MNRYYLYALLGEIFASSRRHIGNNESIAQGLDSAIYADDSPRTVGRHVQVVSYGPGGNLYQGTAHVTNYGLQ